MKVGLFMDLRNPPAWERPWATHYSRALEVVEHAEHLGADSVWLTEHHFFEDGYLPQPLVFAAAIASRTRRIRVGTAIVLGALRHPTHLAEEAAIVDLLSGGRVELGIGAGYVETEYASFGVDISKRFALTDAAVAEVRRLLDEGGVSPSSLQRPFPIWLGYQGIQGARRAGRLGVGLLTLNRDSLEPYRAGLAEAGHDPQSARMGGAVDIIVADDPERTLHEILPHYEHQLNSYQRAHSRPTLTTNELKEKIREGSKVLGLSVLTPQDTIAEIQSRTAGLPVEHVYLWATIAGMPDEIASRHVELTCTTVRTALATTNERGT